MISGDMWLIVPLGFIGAWFPESRAWVTALIIVLCIGNFLKDIYLTVKRQREEREYLKIMRIPPCPDPDCPACKAMFPDKDK